MGAVDKKGHPPIDPLNGKAGPCPRNPGDDIETPAMPALDRAPESKPDQLSTQLIAADRLRRQLQRHIPGEAIPDLDASVQSWVGWSAGLDSKRAASLVVQELGGGGGGGACDMQS